MGNRVPVPDNETEVSTPLLLQDDVETCEEPALKVITSGEDQVIGLGHLSSALSRRKRLLKCSLLLNLLLLLSLLVSHLNLLGFFLPAHGSTDPDDPGGGHHPRPGKYSCPFSENAVSTRNDDNLAIAQVGTSFVAVCWANAAAEVRGSISAPYKLYLKDPWVSTMLAAPQRGLLEVGATEDDSMTPIYSGRALVFNLTDLLPATKYAIRLTNTDGDILGEASVTTDQAGNCGDAENVRAMKQHQETMKEDIQKCLIKHMFDKEAAAHCVTDKVDLSKTCANCWIEEGECTLGSCATRCFFPNSMSCKECSEQSCFSELCACSGLPRWAFPP